MKPMPYTCPRCSTRGRVIDWPPEHRASLAENIKSRRFLCRNCADPQDLDCTTPRPNPTHAIPTESRR